MIFDRTISVTAKTELIPEDHSTGHDILYWRNTATPESRVSALASNTTHVNEIASNLQSEVRLSSLQATFASLQSQ